MISQHIEYLSQFVTERRVQLFDTVLNLRTRYITVVLEDLYQPHNASAVLRSCEGFGIQDIHIIENQHEYRLSPDITLGSDKWLTIHRHNLHANNTADTIHQLKKNGYRIVATSPHKKECSPEQFDLQKGKTALLFGSELKGLSQQALEMADEFLTIPMVGFTESFNISVTAALCIHFLTNRLRRIPEIQWQMTDEEKQELKLEWLRKSIRNVSLIEKTFIDGQHLKEKG